MNFILSRIYYITFYIPLIIEGNKNNIKSIMFLNKNPKQFTDPYEKLVKIKKLSKKYNFDIMDITEIKKYKGITILSEGDLVGRGKNNPENAFRFLNGNHIKFSLIINYEFAQGYYKMYIDKVDYVIFPSKIYAETYTNYYKQDRSNRKCLSNKNLYLGCPKYLAELKDINLPKDQKYCLFAFPKNNTHITKLKWRCPSKSDLIKIYNSVRDLGFKIIVKSKIQDSVKDSDLKADYYFEDDDSEDDLYPSSTMNLINISSLVIYFSSSIIEECFFLKTPFIDFKLDPKMDRFKFLHNDSYSRILDFKMDSESIKKEIINITKEDSSEVFDNLKNKYFGKYEDTNKNIIEYFLKNFINKK